MDFLRKHSDIVLTAVSGLCLALSWVPGLRTTLGFDPAWGAILISGLPLLRMAIVGLFTRFDLTAGVLVSIALLAAAAIVLASIGWMGPVLGALWHNAGSVLVVVNSAMLMSTTRSSDKGTA